MIWDSTRAVLGIVLLIILAWSLSENRRRVPYRVILAALALQFLFALLIFHFPGGKEVFLFVNDAVVLVFEQSRSGAEFLFGPLAAPPGSEGSPGFILAFQALPTAIVIAALVALLYHIGFMQRLIWVFANLFRKSLGISGPESVAAASNLFVGIESALAIRPFLATMPRHELALLLTAGMATIASTVLGLYVGVLAPVFPAIAGHLLTANLLSAPAAVMFARLLVPPPDTKKTSSKSAPKLENSDFKKSNWMQSLTDGAMDGLKLALGISSVLVAFVGLLAVANLLLSQALGLVGIEGVRFETLLGWLFAPIAWLIGVPWAEAPTVGSLLGTRLIVTEVPAYFQLGELIGSSAMPNPRTAVITVYALCGFAHIPSLGIFVGGISALIPERSGEIGSVALRSLLAATLACLTTGAVAGIVSVGAGSLLGSN